MSGSFRHLLRYHRTSAGWSQDVLAGIAERDQTTIAALERGSREPSRQMVLALAGALVLNVSETDRLLYAAGHAPETDYQALYEERHGAVDDRQKWCPKCQRMLPAGPRGHFSRNRGRPDGLYVYCKSCESARQLAYRKRAALRRPA